MHEHLARLNFERDVAHLTPVFLASRRWTVNERQFPLLDVTFEGVRGLRIRLTCDGWNEFPPSEQILLPGGSAWDGPTTSGSIFNAGPHSTTGRPFVCMRGFRGYHTHNSHVADCWSNYRNQDGNSLVGLLDQLSRAWRSTMGC